MKATSKKRYVRYERSLIAHLDILGFQDLIDNASAGHISRVLRQFGEDSDPDVKLGPRWRRSRRREYFLTFSDLCVTCLPLVRPKRDIRSAIFAKVQGLALTQVELLMKGVVVRGGLTVGEAAMSWGLLYGPGIVKAYELESKGLYPRIEVDASVLQEQATNQRLWFNDIAEDARAVARCLREDEKGKLFVDYLGVAHDEVPEFDLVLQRHRQIISANLERHKDHPGVLAKYQWMDRYHQETIIRLNAGERE